ncbi:MAG: ROK family protein [Bacillota bacterium]|nr:ROK family protein [Bacillota bacterium]
MFAIGLDLGGTKIAAGVVAPDGRVVVSAVRPTPVGGGVPSVLAELAEAAQGVAAQAGLAVGEVEAAGLACPGPVDPATGTVSYAPNLHWRQVPVRELLSARLPWPCVVLNDADAAALGEAHFGAGRGAELMLYLTVSTGIGGGIVRQGELLTGAHGAAGEFGHQVIEPGGPLCRCGRQGCLEALASGTATARRAVERLRQERPSLLQQLAGGDPERITAALVGEAAARGDSLAAEVIAETASYLGIGVANLVAAFDPDRVVIGGGLANLGKRLLDPVRQLVRREVLPPAGERVEIVQATLGAFSGVVGAAWAARGAVSCS